MTHTQIDMFGDTHNPRLPDPAELESLPEIDLRLHSSFMDAEPARQAFHTLQSAAPWKQLTAITRAGPYKSPRLTCHYGSRGSRGYPHGANRVQPIPWEHLPLLESLRQKAEAAAGHQFNSAVLHRYRNGEDSVHWHADLARELMPDSQIATLSLGAVRVMHFRQAPPGPRRIRIPLPHGSLLLMDAQSQQGWQHCIHKVRKHPVGERISLTFRQLRP